MMGGSVHDGDAEAAAWRRQWELAPEVIYLNHGGVGLSPRPVLDAWTDWIRRIDEQRAGFYFREAVAHLEKARDRLARFIGTTHENLAFVPNATVGMLALANTFPLGGGDEVLITDHDYWSVQDIWRRACERAGARLVVRPVPVPLNSREELVETVLSAVTPRTRLLIFSHINYRTSLIMPAEALCRRAREMDVQVCIDGAHALGVLPLDVPRLDCDYYVASCHKWLCAPAGTGFLYAHPRRQDELHPLVAHSRGAWQDLTFIGTEDLSRYLSVGAAVDFMEGAGLDGFRRRTHNLAQYARRRISELTGLQPFFPDSPDWYGSMIALPLPPCEDPVIRAALWDHYRIESYIRRWNDRPLIRVSCHLYTRAAEIDRLVDALRELGIP